VIAPLVLVASRQTSQAFAGRIIAEQHEQGTAEPALPDIGMALPFVAPIGPISTKRLDFGATATLTCIK
jgi:hypothetical protein